MFSGGDSVGKSILVADDNEEIIKFLKPYLIKEGFEVITAHDGNETLVKNMEYIPQLILLDIMMPYKIMALDTGADDYIVKPFSTGEVVARVKAVLRRITTSEAEKLTTIKYNSFKG